MKKGTIIYLGGFELPDKNAAAHRVLSNGKALRQLGYRVVFVDIDKSLDYNTNTLKTKQEVQGFDCWSLPYPRSIKEWIQYLSHIGSIKKIVNNYVNVKALIAYNFPSISLYRLKKFSSKNNIKIIADCTEWYSTKGMNIKYKIIKGFDSFLRMRVVHKKLDGLIVISKYLENHYKDCKNVYRIPPLVDLTETKWNNSLNIVGSEKVKFIYSGSPGKNKDKINLIIEALYKLEEYLDYQFNIVGITKEQYIDYYPEHLRIVNDLEDRVKFLGRISHNESLEFLKLSDYSIFFRDTTRLTKAGFPTKFVESLSCKVPVITNNSSDIGDFLKDGENGFLLKEDISEVFKVISNLTTSQIKSMKCNTNDNTFNYINYTDEFRNLFENL